MVGLSVISRHLSVRLSKRNREFERIAMMDPPCTSPIDAYLSNALQALLLKHNVNKLQLI